MKNQGAAKPPDVLYIGFSDFIDNKEIDYITRIIKMGTLVILNLPYVGEENDSANLGELKTLLKKIILVEPLEERNLLRIDLREI